MSGEEWALVIGAILSASGGKAIIEAIARRRKASAEADHHIVGTATELLDDMRTELDKQRGENEQARKRLAACEDRGIENSKRIARLEAEKATLEATVATLQGELDAMRDINERLRAENNRLRAG